MSVIGFSCTFMITVFLEEPVHSTFVCLGFVFVVISTIFLLVLSAQTPKGRRLCLVVQFVMIITSFGFMITFIILLLVQCGLPGGIRYVECGDLSAHGNLAEWMAFIMLSAVIGSKGISLYRDLDAVCAVEEWWMNIIAGKLKGDDCKAQTSNV